MTTDELIQEIAALTPQVAEAEKLVAVALGAWGRASGVPITADAFKALLPNPEPLTPPAE